MRFCVMPFVGQERHEIVKRLVDDFEHVVAGKGPKVVVLSSPPGWGKTRVTQEFYRRIAARQSMPAYWPTELVDDNGLLGESISMNSLLHARKLVYPREVNVPKGASMDWMWWGVLCHQRRNGEFGEAMFESVSQLDAHAAAIAAPTKGQAFDITMNLVGVLGALGVVALGAVGAALAVTGAGKAAFNNRELVTQLRAWWSQRKGTEVNLNRGRSTDDIGDLSRNLAQVTKNKPLVLVIDDAHDADESLIAVLDGLLSAQAKVLVLITTWPGALAQDQNRPIARWWVSLNSRPNDLARKEDLQPLETADLRIVAGEDGLTTSAELSSLNGNVLALRASLRLPAVRREIDAGRTPNLGRYAQGPDAVFHEYWDDLPNGVRHVLAIAAQTGARYVPSLVVAVALHAGIEGAQRNLMAGVDVYRLAREIDETLHAFTDSLLYAVAEKRGREQELSDSDYSAIRTAIASAVLDSEFLDSLSIEARLLLHRQHVTLVREGLIQSNDSAATSAFIVAQAEAKQYSFSRAAEISRLAIAWYSQYDAAQTLSVRHENAYWTGESGKTAEGLALFRELLADRIRVLGANHIDTLETRYEIAWFLRGLGKTNEAIEMLKDLLHNQRKVLGNLHRNTLSTAQDMAYLLGLSGRVKESIELVELVLNDIDSVMGPHHLDALITRINLAQLLGDAGREEEGVALLSPVLTDCIEILGPDHPQTFRARNCLAYLLTELGRTDESFRLNSELLQDEIRILGSDNISTLITRLNIAGNIAELGDHAEAILQLETLHEDISRVLGPDDPNTLTVRHNLAYQLGLAGQLEVAITQLSTVLQDRVRILGLDDPFTLTTRHNLAAFIADSGRVVDAIEQFVKLEKDRSRVLGPDHPDTFDTRLYIISLFARIGQTSEAIELLEVLVDEQTIALGPNHVDTLLSRDILQSLRDHEN